MKIYGPYKRKDNRLFIVIVYSNGKRTTKSYPRLLMEQHLNRPLTEEETVDHIDNNPLNNEINNLQLLSRKDNASKEMKREERKQKLYKFTCPICLQYAEKPLNWVKHNHKLGKAGPFCSRRCAGKASHYLKSRH